MRNAIDQAFVLTVIAVVSLGSLSSLVWCDETILNEHVTLTSIDSPDSRAYQFNLVGGDTISITISVLGDSINLYICNSTGNELLQRTNVLDLEEQWTVPYNGTFTFIIETWAAESANAVVDITLVQVPMRLSTDLNHDGKVDISDIFIIARAFGTRPGDHRWNEIADIDKNGIVGIGDVFKIAKDFGKSI